MTTQTVSEVVVTNEQKEVALASSAYWTDRDSIPEHQVADVRRRAVMSSAQVRSHQMRRLAVAQARVAHDSGRIAALNDE